MKAKRSACWQSATFSFFHFLIFLFLFSFFDFFIFLNFFPKLSFLTCVSFQFVFCCFILSSLKFFTFGQVKGNGALRVGRGHRPTKVFEFVKLILRR